MAVPSAFSGSGPVVSDFMRYECRGGPVPAAP
jgi:hypothetical protein